MLRSSRRRFVRYARTPVVLFVVLAGIGWAKTSKAPTEQTAVVAIGDVHGDFDAFVAILQHAGLIDKQN
jgi:hypothetical protein